MKAFLTWGRIEVLKNKKLPAALIIWVFFNYYIRFLTSLFILKILLHPIFHYF